MYSLDDTLQDLCLFTRKHCHGSVNQRDERQTIAVILMRLRKHQERKLQKALENVCKASTDVCEPAVLRPKRSATSLWQQERNHRRAVIAMT
jgi:hypothetical protein